MKKSLIINLGYENKRIERLIKIRNNILKITQIRGRITSENGELLSARRSLKGGFLD